ncbi:MAG: cell division protein FtsA [Desulfurella sp.]|uniref:cell division protein FtsA n=1 Tax=Desulfurella TaxID=33001 RepID=UPI000CA6CE20|nr:cell division protein FtsA [Desulfurella multipotens]PMP67274.1 MAG: cell division protein FtsA [Desulfurella multipotens]
MEDSGRIIVGLDIGTTKVCTVVGKYDSTELRIIGIGTNPSSGLRKGIVINIDQAVDSIKKSIFKAEQMSGIKITNVYAGISGSHIRSYNSTGVIAVKGNEVTESDIKRVIDGAKAIIIPPDREIIHVIPQEFIVDEQTGIKEPLGMSCTRLEAKVHVVTGSVSNIQNIIKCCQKSSLNVVDIVLQPIASSLAVLTQDEKDIGVCLVDIGGGTTDVAVFLNNSLRHTFVLSIGGDHITNDISVAFRLPYKEAENLKINYGTAMIEGNYEDETIELQRNFSSKIKQIYKSDLAQVIEPRIEEIFSLVKEELDKMNILGLLGAGVVLTGGTAMLENITDLAENIFKLPVRVGYPINIGGIKDALDNPMYSTAIGLTMYAVENRQEKGDVLATPNSGDTSFSSIISKMKKWIKEMF